MAASKPGSYRSAISGKYVSAHFGVRHPATTVHEAAKSPPKKGK